MNSEAVRSEKRGMCVGGGSREGEAPWAELPDVVDDGIDEGVDVLSQRADERLGSVRRELGLALDLELDDFHFLDFVRWLFGVEHDLAAVELTRRLLDTLERERDRGLGSVGVDA